MKNFNKNEEMKSVRKQKREGERHLICVQLVKRNEKSEKNEERQRERKKTRWQQEIHLKN